MESSAEAAEYAAFEEKVKRTVYLDNLSHQVTEAVLRTALDQYGNVTDVQFIPNYIEPKNIPRVALVEMENSKQATKIVEMISNFPFMMTGLPRPVRAFAAEIEMFDDRPRKPGRRIQCQWLEPNDPDFEIANKIKELVKKHASEASCMLEQQVVQETQLANRQEEILKANYKKYEVLHKVFADGTARELGRCYNMNVKDEGV